MPAVTVKGIPEGLLERLRAHAEKNRRSLNSEMIYRLEQSLESWPVDAEEFLLRVKRLQERTNLPPLTDEYLKRAKEEGRP
jgi:hypothetical protein